MRTIARPDPIRIVEAAYAWVPDEARWLEGIVGAASPYDIGGGVIAYTVGIAERTELGSVCKTEHAADEVTQLLGRISQTFPPELAREVFAPTEFVGNAAYRLSRIARSRRGPAAALVRRSDAELPSLWALISGDPRHRSLVLCFPKPAAPTASADEPFPHRDARSLGLVGAHISAALRLRALAASATAGSGTEAVLTPGGRLLHATGPASSAEARASLVEAVRASETARGRMRRSSPEEALGLWTALVQGRWTILDSTDRDGKRLLLARRNPLRGGSAIDLTADERDVVWLAAQGHSYKYIAYELGVPLSTVADRLRRAMRKLRIRSRTELLQRLGTTRRADRQDRAHTPG